VFHGQDGHATAFKGDREKLSRRVLVVTSEMPAGTGFPTAGGGVRAWNLAEGLRGQGFEVEYALLESVAQGRNLPEELTRHLWTPKTLDNTVIKAAADVLVFCHWDPMSSLGEKPCPVVLDLPGPLIVENVFRYFGQVPVHAQAKIRTLAKADAYLVTSPLLRGYFSAWLLMAGVSPKDYPLFNVPIALPDELPEITDRSGEELTFLYSGIAWPWQNPKIPLMTLAETLEKMGRGRLVVHTGSHPIHDMGEEGSRTDWVEELARYSRVEMRGMVPFEKLMASYSEMDVAMDLFEPNIERELASPFRTISFLCSGLAPLLGDYHFLSKDIETAGAGWRLDPTDREGLRKQFEWMLEHPEEVRQYRPRAQDFARQRHTWGKTMGPLVDFCRAPRFRKGQGRHLLDSASARIEQLEKDIQEAGRELDRIGREWQKERQDYLQEREIWARERGELEVRVHRAEHDLEAIRSKFLFRLFKRIQDVVAPERKS
jgi:hypothetical protein